MIKSTLRLKLADVESGKLYYLDVPPYIFVRKSDAAIYWTSVMTDVTDAVRLNAFPDLWDFIEKLRTEGMLCEIRKFPVAFICLEKDADHMKILTQTGIVGWIAIKPFYTAELVPDGTPIST